jgi:hypothetical protein
MKQQYIGFPDSEKFIQAIDRTKPVNLFVGQKNGRPDKRFGIAVDSTILTLSQVQGDEVLYFNDITHRWHSNDGLVMDIDEDRPRRLAKMVFDIARKWLTANDIQFREALLAMPVNYIMLEGKSTFLKYDKPSDSFVFALDIAHAEQVEQSAKHDAFLETQS